MTLILKVDIADVSAEYNLLSALVSDGHTAVTLPQGKQVVFSGEDPRVPGFGWRILTKSDGLGGTLLHTYTETGYC